jgi:hypothetical protein
MLTPFKYAAFGKRKSPRPLWDEGFLAPVVPPRLGCNPSKTAKGLNKNPVCDAHREMFEASLTLLGYGLIDDRLIPFALITVATPAQATDQ